jgi:hypothetical protein
MKTLSIGSKGDEVALLQKKLGVEADGDFGPVTEKAVKDFQSKHNLEPDGIVGPKTWVALGVGSGKCVDPSVIYLPLGVHITHSKGRPVKYIALHYTEGSSSAPGRAKNLKHVFEERRASADFGVDDRDIYQFNPDIENYYCWSVGDKKDPSNGGGRLHGIAGNKNTISIEICSNLKKGYNINKSNHEGWYFTEESLENALKLVKILMKKYNIDIDHVVRHYDISGKSCPSVVGWIPFQIMDINGKPTSRRSDESKWREFKDRLK